MLVAKGTRKQARNEQGKKQVQESKKQARSESMLATYKA